MLKITIWIFSTTNVNALITEQKKINKERKILKHCRSCTTKSKNIFIKCKIINLVI